MSHPVIVRKKLDGGGEQQMDLYSRLNEDRIIFLDSDFNDHMASIICAQIMVLANIDPEQDITIYINSPGGSVTSGLAIYDTINLIPNDVKTIVLGNACSMGAFIPFALGSC
jgi:ATP-dependent Clp protease, protease subunit